LRFNRKIWLNWKSRKPCPTCQSGVLLPPKDDSGLIKSETEESKFRNSHGYYYTDYVFSLHLVCSECNETVVVTGNRSEENYPSDEEIGLQNYVSPKSFFPAPKIISIPKSCPKSVSNILNQSFGLYWNDISSCANKIRIAIEVLMDEMNVVKKYQTKNGLRDLTLHKRIEIYEKTNPEVSSFLLAIKWIGNAGSHFSDVKNDDVLDAYELLEFSLDQLFTDKKDNLIKMRDEINQTKKPRKK
jgi:hypothetical protein